MEPSGTLDLTVAGVIACVVVLCVVERRALARMWLSFEDPRTIAVVRIATGALILAHVYAFTPLHRYAYTDEGLFLTDAAQQVFAASEFAGYGDPYDPSSPSGFFDPRAVVQWLEGPRRSLLLLWDSPRALSVHLAVFYIAGVCFTLGLGTRVFKWITWLAFQSILARNPLILAGEQVFLGFLFCLCLSRCGHAYSLDNLLRWRRHRTEPGAERHRPIPAWPRWLMLVQAVPMFTVNGLRKTGLMWRDGDTLYYTLQHEHFHTWAPEALTATLGTTLFRVATWAVHGFELLFPLAVVGAVLGTATLGGCPRPDERGRLVARACWTGIAVGAVAMAWLAFAPAERPTLPFVVVHGAALGVLVHVLAKRPFPGRWARLAVDRRLWVSMWVVFAGTLTFLLDLGTFTAMVGVAALAMFRGEELAWVGGRLAASLRRRPLPPPPSAPPTEHGSVRGYRRIVVGAFVAAHVGAIAVAILPGRFHPSPARATLQKPALLWLDNVGTKQQWSMFAPQGPKAVASIRVELDAPDGETVDLGVGFHADPKFEPGGARDKALKVVRRMAGRRGAWTRKWHARHVCRAWALQHDGALPSAVRMFRVVTPIPPPEALAHDPARANREALARRSEREIHAAKCATEPHGQLPERILRRHGIDPDHAPRFFPWRKVRHLKWSEREGPS